MTRVGVGQPWVPKCEHAGICRKLAAAPRSQARPSQASQVGAWGPSQLSSGSAICGEVPGAWGSATQGWSSQPGSSPSVLLDGIGSVLKGSWDVYQTIAT